MRHITVRENDFVYTMFLDELRQFFFRIDRYTVRIVDSCQFGWINPLFDTRYLRGGESYHFIEVVATKVNVEVVEFVGYHIKLVTCHVQLRPLSLL